MRKILAIAAFLAMASAVQAQQACRQALALGLDVSGSVDANEYRLQLDGLAAALDAPEVTQAIFAAPQFPVALAVFEWGNPGQERLLVNWTTLHEPQQLRDIATTLRTTTGAYSDPSTGIGAAINYGATLLDQQQHCWRRTLDISGDGSSNTGPTPLAVNATRGDEITVNGLVIGPNVRAFGDSLLTRVLPLEEYYRTEVIHGPGAFVEIATNFDDFEAAMIRKLTRELQDPMIASIPGFFGDAPAGRAPQ